MLPYSLGSSLASMPAAWIIGYLQRKTHDTSGQKWIIAAGLLISSIGFGRYKLHTVLKFIPCDHGTGVLNLLNESSPILVQVIYPLIAGIGLGMLFHAPYQVFCKTLNPQELATGTSAFFLVRFTGATIGLVRFHKSFHLTVLIKVLASRL